MRRAGQLCNWCRLSVRAPASDSGRRTGTARQTTHLRLFFSLDVLSPVSLPGRSAVCVAPLVLRRIGAFLSLLALSPLSLWAVLQSAMPVLARAPLLQPESILSVHSSSLRPPLQSSRQLTAAFSHLLCKPEVSLNNTAGHTSCPRFGDKLPFLPFVPSSTHFSVASRRCQSGTNLSDSFSSCYHLREGVSPCTAPTTYSALN